MQQATTPEEQTEAGVLFQTFEDFNAWLEFVPHCWQAKKKTSMHESGGVSRILFFLLSLRKSFFFSYFTIIWLWWFVVTPSAQCLWTLDTIYDGALSLLQIANPWLITVYSIHRGWFVTSVNVGLVTGLSLFIRPFLEKLPSGSCFYIKQKCGYLVTVILQ